MYAVVNCKNMLGNYVNFIRKNLFFTFLVTYLLMCSVERQKIPFN